jgi:putative intracellular protease/amidase
VRKLGALAYRNFELLDLFGPLEVFGWDIGEFAVTIVAPERGPVPSNMGPAVVADADFTDAPDFDVLLIPGGWGRSIPVDTDPLVPWIGRAARRADYVLSVCTGSALLALSGFLDGKPATTNKSLFGWVTEKRPEVDWRPRARWVQHGRTFTSSGVSAGIDMSLAALSDMLGPDRAEAIALGCEYSWHRDPDRDPFSQHYGLG